MQYRAQNNSTRKQIEIANRPKLTYNSSDISQITLRSEKNSVSPFFFSPPSNFFLPYFPYSFRFSPPHLPPRVLSIASVYDILMILSKLILFLSLCPHVKLLSLRFLFEQITSIPIPCPTFHGTLMAQHLVDGVQRSLTRSLQTSYAQSHQCSNNSNKSNLVLLRSSVISWSTCPCRNSALFVRDAFEVCNWTIFMTNRLLSTWISAPPTSHWPIKH